MTKADIKSMSRAELAAFVSSHLMKAGIEVVLSGGSCVSIYSKDRYVSADLDFVLCGFLKGEAVRKSMEEIGFIEKDRIFRHPEAEFYVEFPPGPPAVGGEAIERIDEMELPTGRLRILTPTDCVKDRLSAYFHWDDLQSLEHAVLVAEMNDIDYENLEEWARNEGKAKAYRKFLNRIPTRNA